MSVTKRTQGRPPRNSGINGRDKLIEATRIYLQSNRKLSLTRTEIAQGCGVTPALISYYFKDKRSLLDAVTKPLLRAYGARLASIFSAQVGTSAKMVRVIRLLIELNTDDAFLVDYMLRSGARQDLDAEDRQAVEDFQTAVGGLVRELVGTGHWQASDPALVEAALWGMCRAFGETMRVSTNPPVFEPEAFEKRIEFVYATFSAAGTARDSA